MVSYPKILAELAAIHWAITPEALDGILAALHGDLTVEDYRVFHGASAADHAAIDSVLGDMLPEARYTRTSGSVGSISINGPIVPRASAIMESSGIMSVERLTREFKMLEDNPNIKTILLVIDSPGGAVTGISEFASRIANSEKDTISYVFGHAASAAYWIASAADSIVSADTGLVGSIGTVVTVNTDRDAKSMVVRNSQSPRKQPDATTDEGKADIVAVLDQLADVFISTVAENRGVAVQTVQEHYGQGAIMGAIAARSVGMIDEIMPLQNLLGSLHLNAHYARNVPSAVDNRSNRVYSESTMNIGNPHEEKQMTFDEARAMYTAEINALTDAARAEGMAAESERYVKILETVKPILVSASYPETVKSMAFEVLSGAMSADILRGAVIAIDAMQAKSEAAAAVADTQALEPTPAKGIDQVAPSEDGILRSSVDADADVARLKEYI